MKVVKYWVLAVCVGLLSACNHGFEGEYKVKPGSSIEVLNELSALVGVKNMIVGRDYLESEGERTYFDKIFVRKSNNGQRYLVFKKGEQEEVWKIIDDNTLQQGNDLINVTLQKIK
ncbi:hypothetical protein [Oceanisphaera sp. W20_SRM_FM3]|uniref:hypothetical protein n=1 Tax=Oceanisphaera sp. W20_SRM_FM3 TaxID=3240267 RepID=UPI003F9C79C1